MVDHALKVQEHHILQAISDRNNGKDVFFTHVKNGPTQAAKSGELAIIDGLLISRSWANPRIRGYEVKVSRSDFMRDEKWHKYLELCHELYFAVPHGMIGVDEVPGGVGLVYYNPNNRSLTTRKKATYREIDIPTNMLLYIIFSKMDPDRHPFFSDTRQYLEEWVRDKEERHRLACAVNEKLRQIAHKVPHLEGELKRALEHKERAEETIRAVNEVLKPYGKRVYSYAGNVAELQRLLEQGPRVDITQAARLATQLHEELSRLAATKEEHHESVLEALEATR